MARPKKNNADYFPHDAGMRNHRKLKALRNKFGASGYGIWCMLLEHLTGADGNEFDQHNDELELLAGDFGVSATEIRDVLDFCYRIELLFNKNGFAYSESLNERLAPVYQKRGVAKELSEKQRRQSGRFCINNTESSGVSVTEMPHIKVNKSKVNYIDPDFFVTVGDVVVTDIAKELSFYEAALNGRVKEHNLPAWRSIIPEWLNQNNKLFFRDVNHLFNSFSKYMLSKSPKANTAHRPNPGKI